MNSNHFYERNYVRLDECEYMRMVLNSENAN